MVSLESARRLEKHLQIPAQITTEIFYSTGNIQCIHSGIKVGLHETSLPHFLFILGVEEKQFSHKECSTCTLLREMEKIISQSTVILVNVVSFSCEYELGKSFVAKL